MRKRIYDQIEGGRVKYGPPSARELYDMAGGMGEHCADVYDKNTGDLPQENPFNGPRNLKDSRSHVLRGGSWLVDGVNAHSASRGRCVPDVSDYDISGRVAA